MYKRKNEPLTTPRFARLCFSLVQFVVGYGMDYADQYRCMPFVGVLAPAAYGASEPITQTNNSA